MAEFTLDETCNELVDVFLATPTDENLGRLLAHMFKNEYRFENGKWMRFDQRLQRWFHDYYSNRLLYDAKNRLLRIHASRAVLFITYPHAQEEILLRLNALMPPRARLRAALREARQWLAA